MGLNVCVCLRNIDELTAETALNGDGEIEGFNFPNTNNQNISSTDYSSKLKGAGRMSYLMKVNTIDSGILKNNAFYNLKASPAAEKIQSFFRGSTFRKKFQKNKEYFSKINLENNKNDAKIILEEKKQKRHKNDDNINNKNDFKNFNEKENELKDKISSKMDSIYSQNFSSESDEKKINNGKINKEQILINDINEKKNIIKNDNNNSFIQNIESSQNNSNKTNKNKENNNSSKENKINDSIKLNYKKGSQNSSEKQSNNEENSNSKKIIKKEYTKSFSSAKISNKSANSDNILNKNKKMIEETINTDIKLEKEKIIEEDIKDFIPNKTKLAEKNFENEIDYGNGWKKYIEEDINSNSSEPSFLQAKLNDEINNSENLISTQLTGEFLTIHGERVLFIGQYDAPQNSNFTLKGKGSLYHKNGVKYEGIFIDGNLNGIGRYITEKGVCYEGIFKDGKMQRKGKQIKTDEQGNLIIYEGSINNYKKEGKGIIECKEFKYEGDFKNDKRNGKGLLIYKDNGNIYEGDFKNDKINGYGIYTFKNKQTYQGEIVNGVFHGKGTYKWADGTYFIGQYVNGVRVGMGEYKFSDGKIYNGPFENGKPHGKGKINIKGKIYDCEFKYGKLVTDIKSFLSAKKKSKG